MAKKAQSGKSAAKKNPSQQAKKAQSPSEKAQARAPQRRSSPADASGIIDDSQRSHIVGIAFIVAAVALIVIVAWPTDAIISSVLATGLKRLLGMGAYLLPIVLLGISVTFFVQTKRAKVPARVAIGLVLIFVAVLALFALYTPGATAGSAASNALFDPKMLETRGGYLGAGIAWAGLTMVGLAVSTVFQIGVILVGLVLVGVSIRKFVEKVKQHREEEMSRKEQELESMREEPRIMLARNRNLAMAADPSAQTRPVERNQMTEKRRYDAETRPLEKGKAAPTKMLTRKLGDQTKPLGGESSGAATSTAKTERIVSGESFVLPDMRLLKVSKQHRKSKSAENELVDTAERLQQTMEDFGIMAQVVDWVAGPTVTLFEVDLPPGVRVSRLTALNDDIALALAAPGVRIFAPIPGTHYVGIEVPNATRENVLLGDVLKDVEGGPLEMAIGKDVEGNAVVCDLAKMPHLLIGGTTGSGKSVGINAMIVSMLMRATPDEVRFIMIDPKRVEFTPYNGIPHLYVPVVTEPKEAASALSWGVAEMERRLKVFSKVGARNIGEYNELVSSGMLEESAEKLCYIVIIIDELSDLMMNVGKEVEYSISRIAQLARAAGIHLIVATQRPSANVVTGLIKANITNRIAFNVASGLDSRVILDVSGAETLIGNGDMLLSKPELSKPLRVQGCYVSPEEITNIVAAVKSQGAPEYHDEILKTNLITLGDSSPDGSGGGAASDDPLLWEAAEIVVASGLGSTSNIQRKLKVGYSRAGRIMDMLEEKGIVGPANGSKPRDVLVDAMELEALKAFDAQDGHEG